MPSFCRHSRLIQNCPICSREQGVEMRPLVSGGTAGSAARPRSERAADGGARAGRASGEGAAKARRSASGRSGGGGDGSGGVRVRRLERGAEDGFHSGLVAGLRSSEDAERLAEEIAFAATRLAALRGQPFGLWGEVAAGDGELEERTWLAFLIAYIGPVAGAEPFAAIERARIPVAEMLAGGEPDFGGVERGERGAYEPERAAATVAAYRAWAQRSGSQRSGFTGEAVWTPERRFERCLERLLALAGVERDMGFELLGGLGATGAYPITVSRLALGGENEVTWAAKRAFGIGDPMLLERRAVALADGVEVELAALDLALFNWGRGNRVGVGFDAETAIDAALVDRVREALGL